MLRAALTGLTAAILILTVSTLESGCALQPEKIRTYALGERVQAGPLVYEAFDTRWFLTLGPPANPRIPANRFLIVHLDVANGGATEANIPTLSLVDDSGQTINELTDGTSVPDWIGVARKIVPMQEQKGNVAFDAPPRHYKLRVTDETDQIVAYIDLPLNFGLDEKAP
jgi:hypothetical protein